MKSNSLMRSLGALAIFMIAGLTMSFCLIDHRGESNENIIKQERQVSGFDKVNISGAFDVTMTQGDKEALTVEADESLMESIVTEVMGNELKIYCKSCIHHAKSMKIYLTIKEMKELKLSGAVELSTSNQLVLQNLSLDVSGAAELEMDLKAAKLDGEFSGASETELKGTVSGAYLEISGASEIEAMNLAITDLSMDVSGASEAKVNVTGTLKVEASGASEVYYKGSPKVDVSSSGASDVKPY